MLVFKFICFFIALLSTLLFISDIITDISSGHSFSAEQDNSMKHAAIRLMLSVIMSITWPVIFLF